MTWISELYIWSFPYHVTILDQLDQLWTFSGGILTDQLLLFSFFSGVFSEELTINGIKINTYQSLNNNNRIQLRYFINRNACENISKATLVCRLYFYAAIVQWCAQSGKVISGFSRSPIHLEDICICVSLQLISENIFCIENISNLRL